MLKELQTLFGEIHLLLLLLMLLMLFDEFFTDPLVISDLVGSTEDSLAVGISSSALLPFGFTLRIKVVDEEVVLVLVG